MFFYDKNPLDYGALGELLLVFVLALEGLVEISELQHARGAHHAESISELFDRFVRPSFRAKLKFVYSKPPEKLVLSELNPSEQLDVGEVIARFEELGFKVLRFKVAPEQESIEVFWDWVVRAGQQLWPHPEAIVVLGTLRRGGLKSAIVSN